MTLIWTNRFSYAIRWWEYRQKAGGGSWGSWTTVLNSAEDVTSNNDGYAKYLNYGTLTGLDNGTTYTFQIRSWSHLAPEGNKYSDPSDEASETPEEASVGVTVCPTTVEMVEDARFSYRVKLNSAPAGNVTVTPGSSDPGAVGVPGPLTFSTSNWSTFQTVRITAKIDTDSNDETVTVRNVLSGTNYGATASDVTVTVKDLDLVQPGVTIDPTAVTVTEGGEAGSYTVKLNTQPAASVTVTPDHGYTATVRVSVGSDTALTFTTDNWNIPQTVTVTPVDDDDTDDETVTVTHSVTGSADYLSLGEDPDDVTVSVTDDDTDDDEPGVIFDPDEEEEIEDRRQAAARKAELVGLSRATLGMATEMIDTRIGGNLPRTDGDGSIGDQALSVMENLLGYPNATQLSSNLTLEQLGEQLWNQSFHISQSNSGTNAQQESGTWALWGAGALRSFNGKDASEAQERSYSGSIKAAWLGADYRFTDPWLAGLALSFATSNSDYSYRDSQGGKTETQLTTFYPYGVVQLSDRLSLWGNAGIGFGDLRHHDNDDDTKQDGELKVYLATIGFQQQLSSLTAWQFSLAGDLGIVKSSTAWEDGAPLEDQSVSLTRARLGVNSSFPLSESTTAYLNLKGRLDGGDLQMGAAEILLGLRYSTGRFSSLLQGRQTYSFDGSYSESGILGSLLFSSHQDGTGLALELQPSYGPYGDLASDQVSLWNDQQLQHLNGSNAGAQQLGTMALKTNIGYGFLLPERNLLLTPFAEAAFTQDSYQQIGLGLSMDAPSWNLKLSGSREESSNTAPTGTVTLMFSKQL